MKTDRARPLRGWTLALTNLIKLAGLVLGVRQGFAAHPMAQVIALSAFMMAGAQVSETVVIAALDRFLGKAEE